MKPLTIIGLIAGGYIGQGGTIAQFEKNERNSTASYRAGLINKAKNGSLHDKYAYQWVKLGYNIYRNYYRK